VIIALLRKQPQTVDGLCTSAGIHPTTFYRLRPLLQDKGIIRETEGGYALWTYEDMEKAVAEAVNEWKRVAFRYPTIEEIASDVGIVPEKAKLLVYKTRDKTGWFMPNEGIIERAREKLGEVLVCSARIRDLGISQTKADFSWDDDEGILQEAEPFVEGHPEMLPKLTDDGEDVTSWPSEALKYLGKGYKPKDRSQPYVRVVRS
jgi:hypothetical protein